MDPDRGIEALLRLRQLQEQLAVLTEEDSLRAREALAPRASELEDALRPPRDGACRIACVGRTRAGKSTLRFVLTGEAENGIGHGGQRTTKEAVEYAWRDHLLVDTPGVGAYEGDDDVEVARAEAHEADLVLWLVGSDGLQLATIKPIVQMLSRGVPLLVVVNHKETFELADLLDTPDDRLYTEVEGRERRLREVLARGDEPVLHVQLDIARAARHAGDGHGWLRSRVPVLEQALAAAAYGAIQARPEVRHRRIAAVLDSLGDDLNAIAVHLDEQSQIVGAQVRTIEERRAECQALFETSLARRLDGADRKAQGALAAAGRLARAEENRGKAQHRLQADMTALGEELVRDLADAASAAVHQAASRLADVPPGPDLEQEPLRFPTPAVELHGDPLNARAVQTVRTVLDVGSGALLFTPVGWALKGLAFVVPRVVEAATPSVADEQRDRDNSVAGVLFHAKRHLEELVARTRTAAAARFTAVVDDPLTHALAELVARKDPLTHAADSARDLERTCRE